MLQIGMIVKILPDAEYSGKFTGYIGKVKNYFSQNKKVGVELFQQTNDASSKGLFWFSESKVVAAGSLPDAMMEYIKADLNATFGVANHIRRSRQTGLPQIKKVIYSGPKTIILWADNTKTIVSCGETDSYEAFRDLVNSTEDRLIVFYNFTEEMERLKGIAKGLNRPVSVLSGEEKNLDAYRYQHNSITFIQYQAGAMGGNFQLANKIIYFSLPQGSELWEQSQKRIHRLGQERPCFYYLMICPGTVEEDILSTLEMRKDYTDELFRKYEQAATAPQSP